MKLVLLLLCLLAIPVTAQQFMDIGRLMRLSRDYEEIQSGCIHSYDSERELFVCAGTEKLTGTIIDVVLNNGYLTTVLNNQVNNNSRISCGCHPYGDTGGCNNGGKWIALPVVSSVGNGQFTIAHGYAIGNERIRCSVY